MLERRKVDNNKIHKALFVNLYVHQICNRFALGLLKIFRKY